MSVRVIRIEPEAPPKPAFGAACNGCGVCCLAEPCPLGAVLSGRRRGACDWVRWDAAEQRYRCGAAVLEAAQLPPGARWLAPALQAVARRWISAGSGCDCSLEVERTIPQPGQIT
jgi:hypothetical protein